jgi:hypothetical protein
MKKTMIKKRLFILFTLILLSLNFIKCGDSGTNPADAEFVLPAKDLNFEDHISPMLQAKCGYGSDCHAIENPKNHLDVYTRDLFVHYILSTGDNLIDFDNPQISPLYLLTKERFKGIEKMPPARFNRPPLTKNQTDGILQWIKEGAK